MKARFTLLAVFLVVVSAVQAQQLSNGGFENWTGNVPDGGWHTIDEFLNTYGETSGNTWVSKESDQDNVAEGSAAAKLETKVSTLAGNRPFYGILNAGGLPVNASLTGPDFLGIPFTGRPDTVLFWAKYKPVGNDTGAVGLFLTRWNGGARQNITQAGPGQFYKFMADTSYGQYILIPQYINGNTPDTLGMTFLSSGGGPTVNAGSTLWIDEIVFGYTGISTDIANLNVNTRVSMFPVPAHATLNVSVSEAMLNNFYTITDINGRTITQGRITEQVAKYDVSSYASGSYIYSIFDANNKSISNAKFSVAK